MTGPAHPVGERPAGGYWFPPADFLQKGARKGFVVVVGDEKMAIDAKLRQQISKTWLDAERQAHPDRQNLVIVTKRPKLKRDQESLALRFGKTKCRVGMAALVDDKELPTFAAFAKYCTHNVLGT